MKISKPQTVIIISLIALVGFMTGCNFSSSARIEPAVNDLRLTPASTLWNPTPTVTSFATHTAAPSPTPQKTSTSISSNNNSNSNANNSAPVNLGYVVNTSPPAPACGLVVAGAYNVNIRAQASLNAALVGTLTRGSWVYASRVSGDWYQVHYPGTPVNGAWISGSVVNLTQPCTCTPNCVNVPPVKTCTITNHFAHGVKSEPYGNGTPVTELGPNTSSVALAKLADGSHYRIQTSAGSAWISVATNVTLSGDCNSVPIEVYNPPQTCTARNQMAQGIMSEPYGNGTPVTQLGPNTISVALARLSDNSHYRIQTPYGTGWINMAQNVTLNGNCTSVPVEIYNPPTSQCRVQFNQAMDVYPMPGWGQPITQLGAGASADALAQTPAGDYYKVSTQAGDGWVIVLYNVTVTGTCGGLPVEDISPPADTNNATYASSAYGFAFDYPANWHVRESGSAVIVTSYDPTYGDPPHAAFADPALVKIRIQTEAFDGSFEEWVTRYVTPVVGSVVSEQTIALPGGLQAKRLDLVGGTGGFPVLLTVINGYGLDVEGMLAQYANFDRVVSTLRAAP